jgi:hypothetical protein
MSWIRNPIYMITHVGGYIICYSCHKDDGKPFWMHTLGKDTRTRRQRAKVVLDHLYWHWKNDKSLNYYTKELLEEKMFGIWMNELTPKKFQDEYRKHMCKFYGKYEDL